MLEKPHHSVKMTVQQKPLWARRQQKDIFTVLGAKELQSRTLYPASLPRVEEQMNRFLDRKNLLLERFKDKTRKSMLCNKLARESS